MSCTLESQAAGFPAARTHNERHRPDRAGPTWLGRCARVAITLLLLPLGGLLPGCGNSADPPFAYRPQDSPAHVIQNLVDAFRRRDMDGYQRLLADDFRFEFHANVVGGGFDGDWSRGEELAGSARMLEAADISRLWLELSRVTDEPVNEIGHETWRRIVVPDTFLELSFKAAPGEEELILRVDGDVHEFFFRRGRSASDTAPNSPTAAQYFLVEWRDLGRSGAPGAGPGPAADPLPTQLVSYSTIKLHFAPR